VCPASFFAAGAYRSQLLSGWVADCQAACVPASSPFSLQGVLSTPVELLEWSCQGLPADTVRTRGCRHNHPAWLLEFRTVGLAQSLNSSPGPQQRGPRMILLMQTACSSLSGVSHPTMCRMCWSLCAGQHREWAHCDSRHPQATDHRPTTAVHQVRRGGGVRVLNRQMACSSTAFSQAPGL
jgi:hypothetical protein